MSEVEEPNLSFSYTAMQPLGLVSGSDLQRFLSAPGQLLQESVALQLAVASFYQMPRSLLEIIVNSADAQVAEAANLHVNLAGEKTEGWQQAVDEILQQRQLGQNDRLAVELLKIGTVIADNLGLQGFYASNLLKIATGLSAQPLEFSCE